MVKTGSWKADSVPMLTALIEEQDLVLSTQCVPGDSKL